jgi:hypothetical protein
MFFKSYKRTQQPFGNATDQSTRPEQLPASLAEANLLTRCRLPNSDVLQTKGFKAVVARGATVGTADPVAFEAFFSGWFAHWMTAGIKMVYREWNLLNTARGRKADEGSPLCHHYASATRVECHSEINRVADWLRGRIERHFEIVRHSFRFTTDLRTKFGLETQ